MTDKYQILIVDDDISVQRTLIDILQAKDYLPHSSTKGSEGLDWAVQNQPAVALVDLRLQEMSGLEVIQGIKQFCPDTECIILTGFASQESAIEAMNLGVFGYLEKPYEMDQLLWMIRNASDKWQSNQTLQKRTNEIQLLYQAGRRLSQTLVINEIFSYLYELVLEILPCDTLIVSIYDPEEEMIHASFIVHEGTRVDVKNLPAVPLEPEGQGVQSTVIRTRKTLMVDNYQEWLPKGNIAYYFNDTEVKQSNEVDKEAAIINSGIASPVILEDRVVGVIQVQSYQENAYTEDDMRMMEAISSQVAVAANNAQLYQQAQNEIEFRKKAEFQLQQQIQRLSALHNIDIAITASMDFNVTMNILLDHIIDQLDVDAAGVLTLNSDGVSMEYVAQRGYRNATMANRTVRLSDPYISQAVLENKMIEVENINSPELRAKSPARFGNEGFVAYYAVPLVVKGKTIGLLEILNRSEIVTGSEWKQFMETLATQTAIALDTTATYNDLQRSNMELSLGIDQIMELWANMLPSHTMECQKHNQEVTDRAVEIARRMNVPENTISLIRRGAMLHDVGMLRVPVEIVQKEGSLTDEEMEIVRMHPQYAQEMLAPIRMLRSSIDIPYAHHERWNGSGYPLGLEHEQIPLAARIFAVVDVWSALLSERPYREAWPEEKVIAYLEEQAGVLFDPKVVSVFVEQVLLKSRDEVT